MQYKANTDERQERTDLLQALGGLVFDIRKESMMWFQIMGQGRVAQLFLAEWTLKEAKSNHSTAPLTVQLLLDTIIVINMSTLKMDAWGLLQAFTIADGAVFRSINNVLALLACFGNALFVHTSWMTVELIIKVAAAAKVTAGESSRACNLPSCKTIG